MSVCPDCGAPAGRLDVPARARDWYLANPTGRAADAAAALGLSYSTAAAYRSRMIRAGLLPRLRAQFDWDDIAADYQDGLLTREIARRIGVRPESIHCQIKRRGLRVDDLRANQVLTGHAVAMLLGYSRHYASRLIPRLKAAGCEVRATRCRGGVRTHWRVTAPALLAFLASPAGAAYEPADSDWRESVADARRAGGLRLAPMSDREASRS